MPEVFGDGMVLQRDRPVKVWGKAAPGDRIEVLLNSHKAVVRANEDGDWETVLPPSSADFEASFQVVSSTQTLRFDNVAIGEVWLCSGQSNMRWELSKSTSGKHTIANANYPNLRLFNRKPRFYPSAGAFTESQLEQLKRRDYFAATQWEIASPATAADFSAVAYHFGLHLMDSLQVPVGLVLNAVGGSTTESWISRQAIGGAPELAAFDQQLVNWPTMEGIHPWVKERSTDNMQLWSSRGSEAMLLHPFAPSFLYDAGVRSLVPFAFRGVIWYQGESNATHPELHERLFATLVESWRKVWSAENLPFLYVQLPNMKGRNRWPEFRAGQDRLQSIPHTAMAVIIDSGDPDDIHPRNKRVVGHRLALLALSDVYKTGVPSRGPYYRSYRLEDSSLTLSFDHAEGLLLRGNNPKQQFTIQGYDTSTWLECIVLPEKIEIDGEQLIIQLPGNISPTVVKYAWSPNPEAVVFNAYGLPLAPFKVELPGNF